MTDISGIAFALDKSEPDVIFHLAAQSFVPRSFTHPLESLEINTMGTANLLEAARLKDLDPVIVFAGSSEEYGLVISSEKQYERVKRKYGTIFPEPERIPELPINEKNPLRPMSPYAVSKVHGEYLMRNYYHVYGMKTVVSRGFNHEGAGRGIMFVTSVITNQVMKLKLGETDKITIGNVNAFRDWSHVMDIVKGYCLLAEKGRYGEVYNQGSMHTNSVLSYILLSLENAGWRIEKIESMKNNKVIKEPTERDNSKIFGIEFEKTKVDKMMLASQALLALKDVRYDYRISGEKFIGLLRMLMGVDHEAKSKGLIAVIEHQNKHIHGRDSVKDEMEMSRASVTLIGTLPPLKGVSPYSQKLLSALSNHIFVEFIGFKKLYPDFLYPGELRSKIKNYTLEIKNVEIRNILTYYNPLSWIWAGLTVKGEIIHAQWW